MLSRRPCDVVMKGGVTSGVVYPAAVYEISRAFDVRSVGGTSAGAIAAAVTAAAQCRRVRDTGTPTADDGYDRLKAMPQWLAKNHRLFHLFKPNRATAALFKTLIGVMAPGRSIFSRITAILRAYPVSSMLGGIPGIVFAYAAFSVQVPWLHWLGLLIALGVVAFGALVVAGIHFIVHIWKKLPPNQYGLVTGVDDSSNPTPDVLCTWLTRELETIAGLTPGDIPLTFGMLWAPSQIPAPNGLEDPPDETQRSVNLQMLTTSVTEGRPYQFPTRTNRYYFKKEELLKFFPEHVVTWMEKCQRRDAQQFDSMIPMPPIGDLPIIVATRMSLAFPLLLSAVPLYAVDYTSGVTSPVPEPVWFSDGGISSNFPIAMFDAPIPDWPTLAINLGSFGPGTSPTGINMARAAGQGRLSPFTPVSSVVSFLSAIFATMQNWNDNMQATLPGFRDRIVTVALHDNEGGLNLDMDETAVLALETRGTAAGKALVDRFASPSDLSARPAELSWESHRWSRLRTTLGCLEDYVGRFSSVYLSPVAPDVTYRTLITTNKLDSVPCHDYPFSYDPNVKEQIATCVDSISELGATIRSNEEFDRNLPRPAPSLVTRPNLDK